MNKIRKILMPVDFSENSRVALDWAMSIANKLGAKVILFHAMETSDFIKELAEQEDDVLSRVKSGAAMQLQQFADKYNDKKISVAASIDEGKPFVKIIEAAKSYDVDLIVMGTHGRTGLRQTLIGSVAEKVVRKAPCPVMIVKHPDYKFELW